MAGMHVTFGWGLDGARWAASEDYGPSSLGEVSVGPVGFADLLATRLACGRSAADQPLRIASYRRALAHLTAGCTSSDAESTLSSASGDTARWFTSAFSVDPWRTAREILAWRDELVSAGWSPADPTVGSDTAARLPHTPRRLATLTILEGLVCEDPWWGPGPADVLHAVARTLADLVSSHASWPIGIESVDVDHPISALPPIWRSVLDDLAVLDVEVTELTEPAPIDSLTVLSADTTWDAAPVAARVLAQWHQDHRPHTVLATQTTEELDRELLRRGLPTLGVADGSVPRPIGQVVRTFLEAVSAPHDVSALAELLTATIAVAHPEDADPQPVRLLPPTLCSALLDSLAEQPGIGGPAWTAATERVRAGGTTSSGTEGPVARVTREFDDLVRIHPIRPRPATPSVRGTDGPVDPTTSTSTTGHQLWSVTEVRGHLDWLRARLSTLGRVNHASALVGAAHRTRLLTEILTGLGESVTRRELDAILDECLDSTPLGAVLGAPGADPLRDVVTSPSRLGTGTADVLWWGPIDSTTTPRQRTRSAERQYLAELGVTLPDRQDLASLTLDSALRGLRRRCRVVAVMPAQVLGGAVNPHPALTFLINDIRQRHPAASLSDIGSAVTIAPTAPYRDAEQDWYVEGLAGSELRLPTHRDLVRPDPVHREVSPGDQLLPTHISYTQLGKILIHPLEWLLAHPLLIRPSSLSSVPTGQAMVGTWMHAAVQHIVGNALAGSGGEPTQVRVGEEEARSVLDELVPLFASELDLPGRSRERATLIDQGAHSIAGLFEALGSAHARLVGSEVDFHVDLPLTASGSGTGTPLVLQGARDLDIVLPDGRRGVVDLKFARSKRQYHDLVAGGQALQLAVYAYSVAQSENTAGTAAPEPAPGCDALGASAVPVGYWSLGWGRMDSAFAELAGEDALVVEPTQTGAANADELMRRALVGLGNVLERLRAGDVEDLGNALTLLDLSVGRKAVRALESGEPLDDLVAPGGALTPDGIRLLERAWRTTFVPVGDARWADLARITGLQEDQL